MKPQVEEMVAAVESLKSKLKIAEDNLTRARKSCRHEWCPVVYDPVVTPAYEIPADPPGTMGIDWRPSCYVPRSEKARWRRDCRLCGVVEYTSATKEIVEKVPVFGQ